jgi:hypothetical protein
VKGIEMSTRVYLTILISLMTNAFLFGIGAVTVLSIPMLNDRAAVLLPIVIVVSIVLAPLLAWIIAPRLRARYWNNH